MIRLYIYGVLGRGMDTSGIGALIALGYWGIAGAWDAATRWHAFSVFSSILLFVYTIINGISFSSNT